MRSARCEERTVKHTSDDLFYFLSLFGLALATGIIIGFVTGKLLQ